MMVNDAIKSIIKLIFTQSNRINYDILTGNVLISIKPEIFMQLKKELDIELCAEALAEGARQTRNVK